MNKKGILMFIIFLFVFILLICWWMDRADKINAGEIKIVSEEMRDR